MRHLAELAYSDMNWLNFRVKAGLRYEYFDYNDYLFTGQGDRYDIRPEGFFSYFVSAHFESFDRRYFPSRGVSVVADYALHTDNFVGYDGRAPFSELGLRIQTVCPVTSRFSLLPALYGRVLIGKQIPYEDLAYMDIGTIVITDKRMLFIGPSVSRSFKLNEIISISAGMTGVQICREDKARPEVFGFSDLFHTQLFITILRNVIQQS